MTERTEILVGLSLVPEVSRWRRLVEVTRRADEAGLDLIGIQDHPYQARFLDTFALIATLLARTSRIRIFPDVANLPLRPPAMLAKTAASLDHLSDGRFELGLGGGAVWDAIEAMGGPRRTPGETVESLGEAIELIRRMWSGQRSVRYQGEHYRVEGVRPGEAPPHEIEIWIGAYGRRMLRLIGRSADGWIPSFGMASREQLRSAAATLDEAAEEAGRDPRSVRRLLNIGGTITGRGRNDRPEPETSVGRLSSSLSGPPEYWQEVIGGFKELGFSAFVFWLPETPDQVALLAEEVAPLIRQAG